MNTQTQRIAIAEACGWKQSPYNNPDNTGFIWGYRNQEQRDSGRSEPIPDYLNDLNAMHEAEKVLDGHQRLPYLVLLQPHCFPTAAQRAEAFLKCLGLWKDDACPQSEKSDIDNHKLNSYANQKQ